MRHGRRTILTIGAGGLLACLTLSGAVFAQSASTTHIHGTITGLTDGKLAVRTTGGDAVTMIVSPGTRITAVTAASLADIKPGSFVGSAARTQPDGTMIALEVAIFPESLRGAGEGHHPMDAPETTMTNGTVGADAANVSRVSGRSITVQYAGGAKTIVVPPGTPIVFFDIGDQALLTAGAHVSVTASEGDGGALSAQRITVGKNGATPPL